MSRMSITERDRILLVNLSQDATLATLVDGRISSGHLNTSAADKETYPLVIVDFQTGRGEYGNAYQSGSFYVWAYSRTSQGDASTIYDAAHDVIHSKRLNLASIANRNMYIQEIERPSYGWNETLRAWYCHGRFILRAV